MFKIIKPLTLVQFVNSMLFAFLSTNVYWLLTVSYVLPEKKLGDIGILFGIEAASYLIEIKGLSVYLDGMLVYYFVSLCCCLFGYIIYENKYKKIKALSLISMLIGLIGATLYYLLSVKIFIHNEVEGTSNVISGVEALISIGFIQSALSITGIWIALFLTTFLSLILELIIKKHRRYD